MKSAPTLKQSLIRLNVRMAKRIWGEEVKWPQLVALRDLSLRLGFSLANGEIQLLQGKWYVTHAGLLGLAQRKRCLGIRTALVRRLSDSAAGRWVFRATVFPSVASKEFVGYGDADPSNVSPLVRGAEMRVAETRAVNRALRKAYGIGLCSVEELGWLSSPPKPSSGSAQPNGSHASNSSRNGQPRLRDQLCLLIRRYNLDPTLVKAYAADFCGTQSLKDASRERVEAFTSQLAAAAKEDLEALVCKLSSYAHPAEVKP